MLQLLKQLMTLSWGLTVKRAGIFLLGILRASYDYARKCSHLSEYVFTMGSRPCCLPRLGWAGLGCSSEAECWPGKEVLSLTTGPVKNKKLIKNLRKMCLAL